MPNQRPLRKSGAPFITFEGGEGAGKSTQISLLADYLEAHGQCFIKTREPGGTPVAEAIRDLVLSGATKVFGEEADALLMASARRQHMLHKIVKALDDGRWVLCDRFFDSTRVYQGILGGVDDDLIDSLEMLATAKRYPDLTIILDIPADVAKERVAARAGAADRFDSAGIETFETIRLGFQAIAKQNPDRCVLLDGNRPVDMIQGDIRSIIHERFTNRMGEFLAHGVKGTPNG